MADVDLGQPPANAKGGWFVKKPIPVRADQWWRNGDHPHDRVGQQELDVVALAEQHPELFQDPSGMVGPVPADAPTYTRLEGAVVRYFMRTDVPGYSLCQKCKRTMRNHGWIDTLEGGHIVCPGDWIITGVAGERYPCKPDIFARTYEPATDADE